MGGKSAVIEALAIAEAVAATVKRHQRRENDAGLHHRCRGQRLRNPERPFFQRIACAVGMEGQTFIHHAWQGQGIARSGEGSQERGRSISPFNA